MGSAIRVMKKSPEERARERKDIEFAKKLQYQEIEIYRRKQLSIMESNENYVITPLFSQIISADPSLQRSYSGSVVAPQGAGQRGNNSSNQNRERRASRKIIAALPTREWMPRPSAPPPEKVEGGQQALEEQQPSHSCIVCLEEYKAGDIVKTLPCLHYFHSECIDKWLKRNGKCPECRVPISSIAKQQF